MIWFPFRILPKKFLGIDIGTSSIKIVELSSFGKRKKLENYGELSALALYEKPFRTFEKNTLLFSTQDVARAITGILQEAKIKTKDVCFSIPDFSTFFTWFELPAMTKEEIPQGVRYEARQHIPLPLSEVTLDWQIIEGEISDHKRTKVKILLVVVPNEVVNQYQVIANFCNLKLQALEAEVFGLSHALIGDEKRAVALVDIGAQSTTCNIVDKGVLKRSHSFDSSANDLTETISKSLGIDYQEAEELKKKIGLLPLPKKSIRNILTPLIDLILVEVQEISHNFYRSEAKRVEKIILAGKTALMPGLREYFQEELKKETKIADPFSNIFCPPILEKELKEMGPSYAIAVGMALRGLE